MPFAPLPELKADIRQWQYMTGRDFEHLDRARTVVLVSCSPLEVHGPHLPVVTDNLEAEALSFRMAELLTGQYPNIRFIHLPPIYVAADVVPKAGSVAFRSSTIVRVLEDLGRSLAKQGFRDIWVSSFHGGPRHFVPIEVAADRVSRRYGVRMVSVFGLLLNQLTGGRTDLSDVLGHLDGISAEELEGDAHGGAVETSMMLHLLGEYVDKAYARLERMTVSIKMERDGVPPLQSYGRPPLTELIRGFRYKLKYFEEVTYAGKPSVATPKLGREMIDELAGRAAVALGDVYTGKLPPSDCHSPLWPIRWVFMSRLLGWAFERVLRYETEVF